MSARERNGFLLGLGIVLLLGVVRMASGELVQGTVLAAAALVTSVYVARAGSPRG